MFTQCVILQSLSVKLGLVNLKVNETRIGFLIVELSLHIIILKEPKEKITK